MNAVLSSARQARQGARHAFIRMLVILAIGIIPAPTIVHANGAALQPGLFGGDVVVPGEHGLTGIEVDEEVVIDLPAGRIAVSYTIVSTSSRTQTMTMVFPLESTTCGSVEENVEQRLDFQVESDGVKVPVRRAQVRGSALEREFSKQGFRLCLAQEFPVLIRPGHNSLVIRYNIIPTITHFMTGWERSLSYPLWPAGNWVNRFRTAVWRVILPDRRKPVMPQAMFGSSREPGVKWAGREIAIKGQGTRTDGDESVVFRASDFKPVGEIFVTVREEWTDPRLISSCDSAEGQACLEKFLQLRVYSGDVRCYGFDDILYQPGDPGQGPVLVSSALPYFRSEIPARKGQMVRSPVMQALFSRMPWYVGRTETVPLNDVEQWNIDFLDALEKRLAGPGSTSVQELSGSVSMRACPGK